MTRAISCERICVRISPDAPANSRIKNITSRIVREFARLADRSRGLSIHVFTSIEKHNRRADSSAAVFNDPRVSSKTVSRREMLSGLFILSSLGITIITRCAVMEIRDINSRSKEQCEGNSDCARVSRAHFRDCVTTRDGRED